MNSKQFGPILYFAHDYLMKVVEGRPLISPHPYWVSQQYLMETKFGAFYGNGAQFSLFDDSTDPPAMVVCAYRNSTFLFKTKQEAEDHLQFLKIHVINKHITRQIEDLKAERREINRKIAQLKSELHTI